MEAIAPGTMRGTTPWMTFICFK